MVLTQYWHALSQKKLFLVYLLYIYFLIIDKISKILSQPNEHNR